MNSCLSEVLVSPQSSVFDLQPIVSLLLSLQALLLYYRHILSLAFPSVVDVSDDLRAKE